MLELSARWARNMVTALRPDRRPPGGRDRQPAPLPRRRDRRRRLPEGGQLRPHLQRVRAAARRARRHARLPARHQAGGARRDPPRRQAAARLRRGGRAEGHRRAAQGLRRRLHHDELEGPGRRPGARLAGRRDRDHGAQAGRRRGAPQRDSPTADDPEAERDRLAAEYAEEHLSAAVAAQRGLRRRAGRAAPTRAAAWRARSRRCRTPGSTATDRATSRYDHLRRPRRQLHRRPRVRRAALAGRGGAGARSGRALREPRGGWARRAPTSSASS